MPTWVTVFGWVNHLGAKPGTRPTQPEPVLCAGWNEYLAKDGEVNRHIAWHTSPCPWSRSVRWLPGWMNWLSGISANLREAVAHWRRVREDALYKWPRFLLFTLLYFTLLTVATINFQGEFFTRKNICDTLGGGRCKQNFSEIVIHGEYFFTGRKHLWHFWLTRPRLTQSSRSGRYAKAAAATSIKFMWDSFSQGHNFSRGGTIYDTSVAAATRPRRPLRCRFDRKSRNLYTPPLFDAPYRGPIGISQV